MKTAAIVFAGGVAIIVLGMAINLLGLGISFAWLPFYKLGAQINYTQSTINTVYNAQRCINIDADYQNSKATVPAIRDEQIPNAQAALTAFESKLPADQTKWSIQEQQEDSELQTDVVGLQQQLSSLQANYTALEARPDAQPCLGTLPTFVNLN